MKVFTVPAAQHFCGNYSGGSPESVYDVVQRTGRRTKHEGNGDFNDLRDALLRESERCIFLATSHYRRVLDMMTASSAGLAYISLYYGYFFAARSLLGMFGAWTDGGKHAVDVDSISPGNQTLRITYPNQSSTYGGTHERTWDMFYKAVSSLHPWIDQSLIIGVTPIGGNPTWPTQRRNEINYRSEVAIELAANFPSSFRPTAFPQCLPPPLVTQYKVLEALLLIVADFSGQLGLSTEALSQLGGQMALSKRIRERIYGASIPGLVRRTEKTTLLRALP